MDLVNGRYVSPRPEWWKEVIIKEGTTIRVRQRVYARDERGGSFSLFWGTAKGSESRSSKVNGKINEDRCLRHSKLLYILKTFPKSDLFTMAHRPCLSLMTGDEVQYT